MARQFKQPEIPKLTDDSLMPNGVDFIEEWKVVSCNRNYEVSNKGRIKRDGLLLSIGISPRGYAVVSLWENNTGLTKTVHRLVATEFIENPENKPMVNHEDSNRMNNYYTNLKWCTHKENMKHAYDFGFLEPPDMSRKVLQLTLDNNIINIFNSITDAAKATGACGSHITKVCLGKLNKTKNFKWRYE